MAKFCTKCGSQVEAGVKFCPKCGHSMSGNIISTKEPLRINKKYVSMILSVVIIGVISFYFFDSYYGYILSSEQKVYSNTISETQSEINAHKDIMSLIKNDSNNVENTYIFKVNKQFSSLGGTNLIEDSNSVLKNLILLENGKTPKREGFLDKLIFMLDKEQNGYFLSSINDLTINNAGFNIFENANATIAVGNSNFFQQDIATSSYDGTKAKIMNGIECREITDRNIKEKAISSSTGTANSDDIIDASGSLNRLGYGENCFGPDNREFVLINNTYLLKDSLLKYKNSKNLVLSISNINGYVNFFLFKDGQKVFSTLDGGQFPFKEIYIPYSYEEDSSECDKYETTSSWFYSEKRCIEYKKTKYDLNLTITFKDGYLISNFFSTNSSERKGFSISLFNEYLLQINKNSDKNIKLYIPPNIHNEFMNIKNYLDINISGDYNYANRAVKDISIDKKSVKLN